MPGVKRQRGEEDGAKVNGSKKAKSAPETASKADKKFANKLAVKDKSKDKISSVKSKGDKNGFKKSKIELEPEVVSDEEEFGGFDATEEAMEVDEDDSAPAVKPQKLAKGDAGKISSAPAALKGSTDGANGKDVTTSQQKFCSNTLFSDKVARVTH